MFGFRPRLLYKLEAARRERRRRNRVRFAKRRIEACHAIVRKRLGELAIAKEPLVRDSLGREIDEMFAVEMGYLRIVFLDTINRPNYRMRRRGGKKEIRQESTAAGYK